MRSVRFIPLAVLVVAGLGCTQSPTEATTADASTATSNASAESGSTMADAGEAGTSGAASSGATSSSTTSADVTTGEDAVPDEEPFTITVLDHAWFSGPRLGYGTQFIDEPFDWGPGPFTAVTLVFELESPCFPFEKWERDPPPTGENWPASCDAFDRTMQFVVDPAADPSDAPGFEVLRAITPFGGPLVREADVTDLANAAPGAHTLRSYVGTWVDDAGQVSGSDGGYFLSVRLEVDPGPAPREVLGAVSLFQADLHADDNPGPLPFELPPGTVEAVVEYRTTGHGGGENASADCIGPAEEFCRRTHHLLVDGIDVIPPEAGGPTFEPWRANCGDLCTLTAGHPFGGDYCAENPQGAVSSVNAPRANWCPGDDVPPIRGPLPAAASTEGSHTLEFAVDGMHPDGVWTTSLTVYALGAADD